MLSLPVVVARANAFVAIKAGGHAKALFAALLAEEHARLVVLRPAAPPRALPGAFWSFHPNYHFQTMLGYFFKNINW